jgi:hypothetical protein
MLALRSIGRPVEFLVEAVVDAARPSEYFKAIRVRSNFFDYKSIRKTDTLCLILKITFGGTAKLLNDAL